MIGCQVLPARYGSRFCNLCLVCSTYRSGYPGSHSPIPLLSHSSLFGTFHRSRRNYSQQTMKELENEYDQDLLRRLIRGEEEAFTLLFRRRQPGIYRFALEMSGSPALAEEVTQEVFLVLMRDGKRYDPVKGTVSS